MKSKKNLVLLGILVLVIVGSVTVTKLVSKNETSNTKTPVVDSSSSESSLDTNQNNNLETTEDDIITVVTSFYPMYIATQNITKDMDHIKLVNLASNTTGCLHDYQLTTQDMKTLESADVFVMNGSGMEGYVEEIAKAYPNLTIIDSSEGIDLLEAIEHHHDEDEEHNEDTDHEEEHDHGAYNSHIWLDPSKYMVQIENIERGLENIDATHTSEYAKNANDYIAKVQELEDLLSKFVNIQNRQIVIFHEAFAYLADCLGLEVIHSVALDEDTSLSAGEIADVIEEVKAHDIKALWTEVQYEDTIATNISKETDAHVYVLDSLVSGENDVDAYITGMKQNIEVLKQALYDN